MRRLYHKLQSLTRSCFGEFLAKYPEMETGDVTLVVLSELYPRAKLITVDDDSRRYRRLRNQAIPLVIPENL
jgi:hypothetical protein